MNLYHLQTHILVTFLFFLVGHPICGQEEQVSNNSSLVNLKDKTGAGAGAVIPDEKVSDNSSGVDANIDDTIINDVLKTKKKRRRIKGRGRKNSLPRRGPSRDPPRDSLRESSRESGSLRDPLRDSSRDSSRDSNRRPQFGNSKPPRKDRIRIKDYSNEDEGIRPPKTGNSKTSRIDQIRTKVVSNEDESDYQDYQDKTPPKNQKPINKRSRMQSKCTTKRRGPRRKQTCVDIMDCYRGQYCATDENLCMDEGCQEFDDECERNGDCITTLKCIAKKCGTMGGEGDYCRDYRDCRGDGYCDKKNNKCRKKKNPGNPCILDKQCHNSICLEIQKEPLSQKGNNLGFGQRRPNFQEKYCALIGAKRNQPCDPRSYHCSIGYVCQKKNKKSSRNLEFQGSGNPSLGGGNFRPTRPRPGFGRPRPGFGRPRPGFGRPNSGRPRPRGRKRKGRKRQPSSQNSSSGVRRGKRQADRFHNDDYYDGDYDDQVKEQDDFYDDGNQGGEFLDYSEEDGDESLDYPEEEKNPVLKMTDGKNRQSIQRRLDEHHCKALSPLGTGESCQSSIECRCGEFCNKRRRVCEPAVCESNHQAACQIYPGFNSNFQCLGNLCMPKNNNKQFKQTFQMKGKGFLKNFEIEGNRQIKKSNATRAARARRRG